MIFLIKLTIVEVILLRTMKIFQSQASSLPRSALEPGNQIIDRRRHSFFISTTFSSKIHQSELSSRHLQTTISSNFSHQSTPSARELNIKHSIEWRGIVPSNKFCKISCSCCKMLPPGDCLGGTCLKTWWSAVSRKLFQVELRV